MITTSTLARPLIALAAALVTVPLAAEQPVVVSGQPVYQERVSFADLDLRNWSAQQALRRRVQRAADTVCIRAEGPIETKLTGLASEPSCGQATYRAARPQIAAAIERAKSGRPQQAMAFVIAQPGRAR